MNRNQQEHGPGPGGKRRRPEDVPSHTEKEAARERPAPAEDDDTVRERPVTGSRADDTLNPAEAKNAGRDERGNSARFSDTAAPPSDIERQRPGRD